MLPVPLLSTVKPPTSFLIQQLCSAIPCIVPQQPETPSKSGPSAAILTATHVYVRSPPSASSPLTSVHGHLHGAQENWQVLWPAGMVS
jgi:hypothetical protein